MAENTNQNEDKIQEATGVASKTGKEIVYDDLKYKLLPISELSSLDIWQDTLISGLVGSFSPNSTNDLLVEVSLVSSADSIQQKQSRSVSLKDTLNNVVACLQGLSAAADAIEEKISNLGKKIDELSCKLQASSLSASLSGQFLPLDSAAVATVKTPTKFIENLSCTATAALWS